MPMTSNPVQDTLCLRSIIFHNDPMYACVTVDVERFSDAVSIFRCSHTIDDLAAMRTLLDTLCDADVPSTLFVLYRFVDEDPVVLDMINENDHELASHGYSHVDLRHVSYPLLEQALSRRAPFSAKGFRAPYFRVDKRVISGLEGRFLYDSSEAPVMNRELTSTGIHMLTPSLMEIPISSVGALPMTSTAIRTLPWWTVRAVTRRILKKGHQLIINVHPWESVEIPRYAKVPFYVMMNTGISYLRRICELLHFLKVLDVEFLTMREIYELHRS